jgi:hypothetical protein
MTCQLIEIQYLGCICKYIGAVASKYLVLEQFESYQKMSYRNRCQVLGPLKVTDLTVPLIGGRDQKRLIRETKLDNSQQWQRQHWRTLESCYNKSPFFLHYRDGLEAVLFKTYETLWELNEATICWTIGALKTDIQIGYTNKFEKQVADNRNDVRNKFLPSNRTACRIQPYQQVFERQFETNLCIIDLLFNLGPQSKDYLLRQTQRVDALQ